MKCVSIVGVCKPLEAVMELDGVEREEDKDYSFSRYVRTIHVFEGRFGGRVRGVVGIGREKGENWE